MKLFECEGKKLFEKYDIAIANGWLWNEVSADAVYPLIAKSQVLTGGRGKAGAIVKVNDRSQLEQTVTTLLNKEVRGHKVSHVYLEEKIDYEKELYLAIIIDRNRKAPVLIASNKGGIDIENVPDQDLLTIPVNPLIGIQPFMMRKVAAFLKLESDKISAIISKIWNVFNGEKAELVEINPLFMKSNGELIAGDAKVILDSHEKRVSFPDFLPRASGGFEERCSKLGAVGVELDGDIVVITSGAGLGMATFDLVCSKNKTVRALVDLGGHVIHDIEAAEKLIEEVKKLNPKGIFFNFYFQVASCKVMATAIASKLGGGPFPVVVRMRGIEEAESATMLSQYSNIYSTQDLQTACEIITKELGGKTGVHHH
ncbi:ATP-grasp domain-containing protein [Metabacillus arenae]|uniref:Uncharacterized protein n=1 Tax=Metabacillus arenae TaxID=2771434 RepID=A0A926RYT8_9BACI|nr:ATP-grasp domain-containing protein [Metabacillus arenae]MBD1381512.1 hypothetical protein [Metabacillus arenae]